MAVYFTENRISWVYVQSLGKRGRKTCETAGYSKVAGKYEREKSRGLTL